MNDNTQAIIQGSWLYDRAASRVFWQKLISQLRGKPVELLSYDLVRAQLRLYEGQYDGLHNVPLDKIVGSVGRYRDFTASFLPTDSVNRERWSRVYAETIGDRGLPPIEVYCISDSHHCIYFVRDGNHRVSVARAMGLKTIEAHVTYVTTKICLEELLNTHDIDAAGAYVTFLKESGLAVQRPDHDYLFLSEPTRYNDLLGHIRLHTSVTGKNAADWHDHVYMPTVELIREHNLLKHFEGRTEADLYLWLVDHLCDLERCYVGSPSDLNPALADFLRLHRLPIPQHFEN